MKVWGQTHPQGHTSSTAEWPHTAGKHAHATHTHTLKHTHKHTHACEQTNKTKARTCHTTCWCCRCRGTALHRTVRRRCRSPCAGRLTATTGCCTPRGRRTTAVNRRRDNCRLGRGTGAGGTRRSGPQPSSSHRGVRRGAGTRLGARQPCQGVHDNAAKLSDVTVGEIHLTQIQ